MLFNEQDLGERRKDINLRVRPPIPKTNWQKPNNPPNLEGVVCLGLDTETYDPFLRINGPGWARGKSHLVGVSLAAEDCQGNQQAWYFPLRHEVNGEENLPPERVLPWLNSVLETRTIPKIGANITYDVGTLQQENVWVKGPLYDVQFAEALLNETAKTALDNLAEKYLHQHKVTTKLYEWCKAAYGGSLKDQRANIYRAPASLVGPYAEADAYLPLQILKKQWPKLEEEGLLTVYNLECRLIPLIIKMRYAGVQVNIDKAYELYDKFGQEVQQKYKELYNLTGIHGSVGSNDDVAKMFDAIGIKYEYTKNIKPKPSITKNFLNSVDHPVARLIEDIRTREKLRSTYLKGSIIDGNVNGKIYPQLNQLRADNDLDGGSGTITGRFSGDLQQIPSRSKLGKQIKKLFIPYIGHTTFCKTDASQIEYRFLAHFAVGPGSDELRKKYNDDPKTDYHKSVQDDIKKIVGAVIERKLIKNVNFGLIYGSGKEKLASTAGIPLEDADKFFEHYHKGAPYVQKTMASIIEETIECGYVRTILGRKVRFTKYEPIWNKKKVIPLSYDQAIEAYGYQLKLAGTYKSVNYKLQGSATGDTVKLGMLKCYEAGLFDYITPNAQVHDELTKSLPDTSEYTMQILKEINYMLSNCIKLRVPLMWNWELGPNWAEGQEIDLNR